MAQLTRPEAVVLALFSLGATGKSVDTEDVAVRAAEIVPGMFSWQKYSDRIDKELVRVALSDARLKKGYVVGSHNRGGWMLTPTGQEFARLNSGVSRERINHRESKEDQQWKRERARMMNSKAYERYVAGDITSLTDDEADAFFRINLYVRGQGRERKIARIQNQFGHDPELGQLVTLLAARALGRQ